MYSPRTGDAKVGAAEGPRAAETLTHWGRNRKQRSHEKWESAVSDEATQKLSILSMINLVFLQLIWKLIFAETSAHPCVCQSTP